MTPVIYRVGIYNNICYRDNTKAEEELNQLLST